MLCIHVHNIIRMYCDKIMYMFRVYSSTGDLRSDAGSFRVGHAKTPQKFRTVRFCTSIRFPRAFSMRVRTRADTLVRSADR